MVKGQSKERRRFKRVSILQDVQFGDQEPRSYENISEDGMFIKTRDVFMEESILDLKFTLSKDLDPITVQAKVCHATEGKGMGVQFLELKPEDRNRIKEYIKTNMA